MKAFMQKLQNNVFHVKTSPFAGNQLDFARNENPPKERYIPFLHESLPICLGTLEGETLVSEKM